MSDAGADRIGTAVDPVDLVALFAIVVFSVAWYFYAHTDAQEPLNRLFFATLMIMGAGIGILGFALRLWARS